MNIMAYLMKYKDQENKKDKVKRTSWEIKYNKRTRKNKVNWIKSIF